MTNQRVGYGRVSTTDQNPDAQSDALLKARADALFIDRFTGTKSSRPEWDRAKAHLRAGDTLVVTRLDRLGRSTKDLLEISDWLRVQGVDLVVTEQPIDTTTAEGRLFFSIVAAVAEFEHELIVARTRDGLAAARARGRKGGRKKKVSGANAGHMLRRYEDGETVTSIAASFNVTRPTVYRALEGARTSRTSLEDA
ncbi:recombinase family protein [Curtobacterium sp. MCLR17_044]|uniref:recombinase family protein n=1 Tax=Curtobacterium sp. MCLR17_044 TaxID=2175628 RepID=UPI000DA7D025|nr:recombinase family protein [Curtobacterium sp. MCLR17_044]PZE57499.1 recombinase family protein [Curtobacterium sp. MCLR17_044]